MSIDKENLRYDIDQHLWFLKEGDVYLVGITDHAQEQLGEILYIELPEKDPYDPEEFLFCIESGKKDQDLNAPFELEVTDINLDLEDEPYLINDSPYENWIFKIKILDESQVDKLGTIEEYQESIKK